MPKKLPPTGTDKDINLASLSQLFVNEDAARAFLESKLWPNGPVCPHCACAEIYALTPKAESPKGKHVRKGVYKCKACRKQFTVRIGTIFEESKVPLCKWLMAIHLMTSSKKGVSSHQIARELGITQKSAWFVNHRIREAMKCEPLAGMLSGVVEADETFVGGKPANKSLSKRKAYREARKAQGKGSGGMQVDDKTPVVVLVERDGRARARPVERVSTEGLREAFKDTVSKEAVLHTDGWPAYDRIGVEYAGHESVSHLDGIYAKDGVHVNSAESFFALLKRGHYGIFHHYSKKHLHRYCTEFSFRWDHRKVTDGERMVAAIKGAEGKRLKYREPA